MLITATFAVGWIVEISKFSCWIEHNFIYKWTSFPTKKTAMDYDNFNNNNNNNNNNNSLNECVIYLRLKFIFPQVGCRWLLFCNHEKICISSACDGNVTLIIWDGKRNSPDGRDTWIFQLEVLLWKFFSYSITLS